MKTGLLLFAHGARDPNWSLPFRAVLESVRNRAPDVCVELCFLEFMSPNLIDAGHALDAAGCTQIDVVPVVIDAIAQAALAGVSGNVLFKPGLVDSA